MVSRRRALRLAAGSLAAVAGCLGDPQGTPTEAPTDRPSTTPTGTPSASPDDRIPEGDDGPTRTPGDVPEWTPEWSLGFDAGTLVGLDAADGLLYATLSSDDGPSAVAAVDPADRSVRWRTESAGEAVGGSHAGRQGIARGQWGVTTTDDAVYAVAGPAEERRWSVLHALDRATGERRWSLRRDRRLAVEGVLDGLVVATGLEFFPAPGKTPLPHQTPEEPLSTVVYGVDAADGSVRWTHRTTGVRDVSVSPDGVYVAAGSVLEGLAPDGATRFTYGHGPATRVEATAGRAFYLTGEDETATLHGVSPAGGTDWTLDLPVHELLLDGDRLYAGGDAVVRVAADGTVVWRDDDYGQWLLVDPDRDTLYTRSGVRADRASAHAAGGGERWTFDPPSNNAWPEAATSDALVVSAITADDGPFLTVYAVDAEGRATAALDRETVFDAVGVDGTVYLADGESTLLALVP